MFRPVESASHRRLAVWFRILARTLVALVAIIVNFTSARLDGTIVS